jgi:hypothetical protein
MFHPSIICKSLVVANFKLRLWWRTPFPEAEQRPVVFLGTFFVVFLGEAGLFVPFNATTFFVGVVVTTAGCLVGVATIFVGGVATVGFLVGVDALAAPFLVGVEATTVSFLRVSSSVGVGLLLGSGALSWEPAPSWE